MLRDTALPPAGREAHAGASSAAAVHHSGLTALSVASRSDQPASTFLFTDIEDSTRPWVQDPER